MIESSRKSVVVLAASALLLCSMPVNAELIDEPLAEGAAEDEEQLESFFPELPEDPDLFSLLEREALFVFEKNRDDRAPNLAFEANKILGIFQNNRAWKRASLEVCFVQPAPELDLTEAEFVTLSRTVREIAIDWNSVTGIPKLDFGNEPAVNLCEPGRYAIAVEFTQTPSQSKVGRASLPYAKRGLASMDLQISQMTDTNGDAVRQLILHEFGHALGLLHEFRHSDGQCWSRLNKPKLYAFYQSEYGITDPAIVKTKLVTYDPKALGRRVTITGIDPNSVMMYSFPMRIYDDPSPPCLAGINSEISDGDEEIVQIAYTTQGSGLMQLAGLSRNFPLDERRIVDAYIAAQAASDSVRGEILVTIGEPEPGITPAEVADMVFDAMHSPQIQLMLAQD